MDDPLPPEPSQLHAFFRRAVERWPEEVALEIPPGQDRPARLRLSYRELDDRSARLAARLPAPGPESLVGILLPRSSEHLFAAQLAVLSRGAAFVCLDPALPDAQIATVLQDALPLSLVCDEAGAARAAGAGWKTPLLRADLDADPGASADAPHQASPPGELAYLIYTSGTTGRPKGVEIRQSAIAQLVASDLEAFGLGPGDRVAQGSSPSYDSAVEETWLALASGATLVVMDDEAVRLGPDLVAWLRGERITVFCPPPTLLRSAHCADPESALPELRLLYVGGEALTRDVSDRWGRGRRLENGYGPTECTVTCLRGTILPGEEIHIGTPVPGARAWVLDENLDPLPDGSPGELCLGGAGLARGYRGQPALTAEKFPVHPVLGRLYRTGDLAHREPSGKFVCHGRLDAQVKLRGYRIELEAVETRLAECPGVREAACAVQGQGLRTFLAAFLVPEDPASPPDPEQLRLTLSRLLPAYMVPARFAFLEGLPTSIGGKLDRRALPPLEAPRDPGGRGPSNPVEARILQAVEAVLQHPGAGVDQDFFTDLGGDSLSAAMAVSLLREDPATASLSVRDFYEARTPEAIARRIHSEESPKAPPARGGGPGVRPFAVTLVQGLCLLAGLGLAAPLAYFLAVRLLPLLLERLPFGVMLALSPLMLLGGTALYSLGTLLLTWAAKRLLLGRYRAGRQPAWGSFYLRHWVVLQAARLVPWRLLEGTPFQIFTLRALGARIGEGVHLHRGVHFNQGGWDLLEIGDEASLGQDASVRLVDFEEGEIVLGPVRIGAGATLEVRASLAPDTEMGEGSYLEALAALPAGGAIPAGEAWAGVPARPVGPAPPRPVLDREEGPLGPLAFGLGLLVARAATGVALALPLGVLAAGAAWLQGLDAAALKRWLLQAELDGVGLLGMALLVLLSGPPTLALAALLARALGPVRAGVIPRWSLGYLRVWLKTGLLQSAGEALSGTLFWPLWLRAAGMRVGRDCEISTILDVVPELVEIGDECFFADGIYLGGPRVHRGTVRLAPLRIQRGTFFGNHAVVPAGQTLPPDVLIGVSTLAAGLEPRAGTSWFGLPPFELPRREVVACDRRLTFDPSPIRYWNRVLWELARFLLPVPLFFAAAVWARSALAFEAKLPPPAFYLGFLPLASLGTAAALVLAVVLLKWILIGRVKEGTHPLWSCWCSRWDFLYVAWGLYARATLSFLEGSLLLSWVLRALGMRIGSRVLLGPGFAQVVDPDMLALEDGCTVNALFQAHTFEDRVLKIAPVRIHPGASVGPGTVVLYGAEIGAGARVGANGVVMKREHLLPGHHYEGCPTVPV
ncbi:MAG: amino acid adenylation domain-containing protein [Acidobacteria bacterium]|nr:amino acid adenylation domain-containing protein [Acidobacteriota bacterium]